MKGGFRALHFAAACDRKQCLELLLSHGADINVKNKVSNDNNMNIILI